MPGIYPVRTSRVPVTVRTGPFGSSNPAAPVRNGGVPRPSTLRRNPPQSREHFEDARLNRLQDKLNVALAISHALPFGDGDHFPGVSFPAMGTVIINHGLGAAFSGWLALSPGRSTGYPVFGLGDMTGLDPTRQIAIQSKDADAVTADIWVFR